MMQVLCEIPSNFSTDWMLKVLFPPTPGWINHFNPVDQYKNTYANSVDPDETAHNEPSHQDLHYLPVC